MPKAIELNNLTVTHTGLIGMLEGNQIDIALASLSLAYDRSQVMYLFSFILNRILYHDYRCTLGMINIDR